MVSGLHKKNDAQDKNLTEVLNDTYKYVDKIKGETVHSLRQELADLRRLQIEMTKLRKTSNDVTTQMNFFQQMAD